VCTAQLAEQVAISLCQHTPPVAVMEERSAINKAEVSAYFLYFIPSSFIPSSFRWDRIGRMRAVFFVHFDSDHRLRLPFRMLHDVGQGWRAGKMDFDLLVAAPRPILVIPLRKIPLKLSHKI
jgi:hypothetical protein